MNSLQKTSERTHPTLIISFRLSVIAFGLCTSAWATLICTLIAPFACGVFYGIMSLGKKADSATMAAAASGGGNNYKQFENDP